MKNFDYQTPTRLIFGKGVVAEKPSTCQMRCLYSTETKYNTRIRVDPNLGEELHPHFVREL